MGKKSKSLVSELVVFVVFPPILPHNVLPHYFPYLALLHPVENTCHSESTNTFLLIVPEVSKTLNLSWALDSPVATSC